MCSSYRFPTPPPSPCSQINAPDPSASRVFSAQPPPKLQPLSNRVGSRSFKSYATSTIHDAHVAASSAQDVDTLSFYELLGIPESGTQLDIKQAYKQLARKYHPDASPPDRVHEYTRTFIRVQEAYETLSNPRSRALYDSDMARGLHLAFTAHKRYQTGDDGDEIMEERSEWKGRWKSQLSELKKRSVYKDTGENMSWGARMRRQKSESSS